MSDIKSFKDRRSFGEFMWNYVLELKVRRSVQKWSLSNLLTLSPRAFGERISGPVCISVAFLRTQSLYSRRIYEWINVIMSVLCYFKRYKQTWGFLYASLMRKFIGEKRHCHLINTPIKLNLLKSHNNYTESNWWNTSYGRNETNGHESPYLMTCYNSFKTFVGMHSAFCSYCRSRKSYKRNKGRSKYGMNESNPSFCILFFLSSAR